ncbi:MAG TPA: hypothetical protein ENN91_02570 [Firmicutes bacterium]|nr:hypothetical protein [Bacillota bacterium]
MNKAAAKFMEAVKKYKSIVIYIPGSPDPDAIASAYAIKYILRQLGIDSDIIAEKRLSLTQNQAFIDRLKIPILFSREINLNKYEAYIVPDFQSNRIDSIGDSIPCAVHIDHHGRAEEAGKADFSLVRNDVGSTSTLVALIIKNLNLDIPQEDIVSLSTALIFGLQTDTDQYKNISALDIEALSFLSAFADREILEEINSIPPSLQTLQLYNQARENETIYKDWAFYGLGYVDARHRDSIAITADMIMEKSSHKVIAVVAVIENSSKKETYLDVSLRSNSGDVDLNRIIKGITPNGGGRKYKGAYQVKLNYLQNAPDKEMLWKVVEAATIETLRKSRDSYYMTEIEKLYTGIRDKISSLFKKEKI